MWVLGLLCEMGRVAWSDEVLREEEVSGAPRRIQAAKERHLRGGIIDSA